MNCAVIPSLEDLIFNKIQKLEKDILDLDKYGDYINLLNTNKDKKSSIELAEKFVELKQILYILIEKCL